MALVMTRERPGVRVSELLFTYLDSQKGGVVCEPGELFWTLAGQPLFAKYGITPESIRGAAVRQRDNGKLAFHKDPNTGLIFALTVEGYKWRPDERHFIGQLNRRSR